MVESDSQPKMSNADIERNSLEVGKWGNLLMAVVGVAAAYMSRSDALLVDGLYSGVNFFSAMIAAWVGASVLQPADRRYPYGYAAYEALYVKFRAMVLLLIPNVIHHAIDMGWTNREGTVAALPVKVAQG